MERPLVQIALTTLEAQFTRLIRPGEDVTREDVYGLQDGADYSHGIVTEFALAEGLRFLCPLCYTRCGGAVGCHIVLCWFEGVPPAVRPGPGRWRAVGTGISDLSFVPGIESPSVRLRGGCAWHGYVRHGFATLTTG